MAMLNNQRVVVFCGAYLNTSAPHLTARVRAGTRRQEFRPMPLWRLIGRCSWGSKEYSTIYIYIHVYIYIYISICTIYTVYNINKYIYIISSRHGPSSRKQQRHQCVFDALMHVGADFSITYMDRIDVILRSDSKIFKLKTPLSFWLVNNLVLMTKPSKRTHITNTPTGIRLKQSVSRS